jgi:putative methanogenesis marker protein 8
MLPDKVADFIKDLEKENGILPADLHITRKACALVAISNGEVIKIQNPRVHHCPLFTKLFDHEAIDKKSIKDKFARHTIEWGMFTCDRKVCDEKIVVPFGASEMLMYALKRNNIDVAVTACDGAGTVITSNPEIVQGIGAYMNGLFYTSPVKEVIERIKGNNGYILSPEDAEINQFEGVKKAVEMGFKNIAVTIRGDENEVIGETRKLKDTINNGQVRIVILAICNTGIDRNSAEVIRDCADLAWACASSHVREIVGPESILQVGMKIPVFVLSKSGLDFISSYSSDAFLKEKLKDVDKKHYITSNKYEENSIKLNMGKFSVFLYETPSLPLSTADEPQPLI